MCRQRPCTITQDPHVVHVSSSAIASIASWPVNMANPICLSGSCWTRQCDVLALNYRVAIADDVQLMGCTTIKIRQNLSLLNAHNWE